LEKQAILLQNMTEEVELPQVHLQDLADSLAEFLSAGAAADLPAVQFINSSTHCGSHHYPGL